MSRTILAPKLVGETRAVKWDFASLLATNESLTSSTVTASVYSGTDSTPSAILSGSASFSGTVITQLVTSGVAGVIYELKCLAGTSQSQQLEITSFLAIEPDLT